MTMGTTVIDRPLYAFGVRADDMEDHENGLLAPQLTLMRFNCNGGCGLMVGGDGSSFGMGAV